MSLGSEPSVRAQRTPPPPHPAQGAGTPEPVARLEQPPAPVWDVFQANLPGPSRSPAKSWAKATPTPPLSSLNSHPRGAERIPEGFFHQLRSLLGGKRGELKPQAPRHSWVFANPGTTSTFGAREAKNPKPAVPTWLQSSQHPPAQPDWGWGAQDCTNPSEAILWARKAGLSPREGGKNTTCFPSGI